MIQTATGGAPGSPAWRPWKSRVLGHTITHSEHPSSPITNHCEKAVFYFGPKGFLHSLLAQPAPQGQEQKGLSGLSPRGIIGCSADFAPRVKLFWSSSGLARATRMYFRVPVLGYLLLLRCDPHLFAVQSGVSKSCSRCAWNHGVIGVCVYSPKVTTFKGSALILISSFSCWKNLPLSIFIHSPLLLIVQESCCISKALI